MEPRTDTIIATIEHYAADDPDETPGGYVAWLAPLDTATNDGDVDFTRIFRQIDWREPPLPLTFSDSEMGHGDAIHVGNLINFRTDQRNGVEWVVADIEWDDDTEAAEARRLVDENKVRGVSVHLSDMDAEMVCLEEDPDEGFCVSMQLDVASARIAAATIVLIPAFEDAGIEPVAATLEVASIELRTVTAADLRSPAAAWFQDPGLEGPTPITVDDDGHIYGHLALWETCHRGYADVCVTPPRDSTDYAAFHQNARIELDDGTVIGVGCVTMDGDHANPNAGRVAAERHYADTALTVAYVRAGEDQYGIWVSGALRPGVTDDQITTLRRHPLSGDWRPDGDKHSLIAALVVNVPGFPIAASIRGGEVVSYRTLSMTPVVRETVGFEEKVVTIVATLTDEVLKLRSEMAPLLGEVRDREAAAIFATFADDS